MDKKVIIFGSTGNCGKYCVKSFIDKNYFVYGVSRSKSKISNANFININGDIRDDNLYTKLPSDVDLVINLAGVQPSILKTSENINIEATLKSYLDININGVFKILEFVRKKNIPNYIYTTSHREYENYWKEGYFLKNNLKPSINFKGDHAMYAISKTSAMMIGNYFSEAFGIRVFNLRLPMIFLIPESPYYLKDGKKNIMPFLKIIRNAIDNKPLEIWGDPKMTRDYVHIDNLISLIELCYKSSLDRGTFNVGTGEAVTTENFVRAIGNNFSKNPENIKYIYNPKKKTYKCAIYDVEEQKNILGYKPIFLNEMLLRLKQEITNNNSLESWGWIK